MKRLFALILTAAMLMLLCACVGNVAHVQVEPFTSERYTDAEVHSAMDVALDYFKKHFSGCTMTSITYAGDAATADYDDWIKRDPTEQVIVLVSTFEVGPTGGDGSLNPNSTYTNWKWILVRPLAGGDWRHADHGYG